MTVRPAQLLPPTLALAVVLAGCMREPAPDRPRAPKPVPAAVAAAFTPPSSAPLLVTPVPPAPAGRADSMRVALEVARSPEPRRLELDWHRPAGPGPHPVIVLLPVSGGHYELEGLFARYFAARGYAALVIRRDESYADGRLIDAVDGVLQRSVVDGRHVVDWIGTRPEFAPGALGLFGISLGGIEGAVLAALEPRFKAAVLGLAGGDLPEILVNSNHAGLVRDRRDWLAETGHDLRRAESFLRETLAHEPLRYAAYGDPQRLLLILARFDRAVPYRNGQRLRVALGNPQTIVLPTGHFTAVVAVPWLRPVVLDFFAERLGTAGPAPARPVRTAAAAGPPGGG